MKAVWEHHQLDDNDNPVSSFERERLATVFNISRNPYKDPPNGVMEEAIQGSLTRRSTFHSDLTVPAKAEKIEAVLRGCSEALASRRGKVEHLHDDTYRPESGLN